MTLTKRFRAGVLYGKEITELYDYANENNFALPAVNVTSSCTINAVLETAKKMNAPVIIQFGNGECSFFAGQSLSNESQQAAIKGSVAAAMHVHTMAETYGVPVVLHTDHCNRKVLAWIDGLLSIGEAYYQKNGRPLFSSHMLDFSEEPLLKNISTSKKYLERLAKIEMGLEIELGVTGGEEDHADNTNVDNALLYTQPSEVAYAFEELSSISNNFSIAASFGNVHGVYRPGNIKLEPLILKKSQTFIEEKHSTPPLPVNFVFHGGSGSSREEIRTAIDYGVIKMNINTDLQWAFWEGVNNYVSENHDYLQTQIGNPDDADAPNKKYYDPRKWLRSAELHFVQRLERAFKDLNCCNVLKKESVW